MQQPIPNPALKSLEVLLGEWQVELSNMSFGSDPAAIVRGQDRFTWLEDGAFLIRYSEVAHRDFPNSVAVIGLDDSSGAYSMLYCDSRGVARIYAMSLADGVWQLWRNAPGFWQRFTGTFSADDHTIAARWEKSSDGVHWEHDFNLTYQRTA